MDPKVIENELKSHKIREGPIYKRSKFLQEWQQRWMVLTMNYILIFTNRNLKQLVEFVDLREVKTYKSYLRKEEDMIPAGFKIRTLQDMLYFCARNCNQKWTWIVSLERLMDFKYAGKSPYNNADWIINKGFMSQRQFERGKFDEPEFEQPKEPAKSKVVEKPKQKPKIEEPSISENDLKKKMAKLDQDIQKLKEKEEQIHQKERQQEQMFLFELNKLKKTEQSLRQLQLQLQEKARQAQRIIAQGGQSSDKKQKTLEAAVEEAKIAMQKTESEMVQTKEVDQTEQNNLQIVRETLTENNEQATVSETTVQSTEKHQQIQSETKTQQKGEQNKDKKQQQEEQFDPLNEKEQKQLQKEDVSISQKPGISLTNSTMIAERKAIDNEDSRQKTEEITPIVQEKQQNLTQKQIKKEEQDKINEKPKQQPKKEIDQKVSEAKKQIGMSKRIKDMKNFFESQQGKAKPVMPQTMTSTLKTKKESEKKVQKKDDAVHLNMCRDRAVVNLLQEFHPKAYNYPGLRYIIEFLITICSERSLGYQSFLIREAKANANRFLFAQVLLELINNYKKYDQFGSLAKVIEVLIFEAPGIFKLNHFDLIKRKLIDLVYHAPEGHNDIPILLKTLYVVHKMKNIEKDEKLKEKLTNLAEKITSIEGKNWARKLIEDL